jgi:hypothetical protein
MHHELRYVLGQQRATELRNQASEWRLANAVLRGQDNASDPTTTTTPSLSALLGRLRARLHEHRAEAFPLWQAAKAGLARVEAGVEAVEETIEAIVEAVEETIEGVPDKTSDLA